LAPSCTSRRHDRIFSSPYALVHGFSLPHAPYIGQQLSESLGTSNTLLSSRFGILFLLYLILLTFSDADFMGCGIDRKSTFGTYHFLGLHLFAGLLKNNF
jgi:hypothetical protein